MGTTSVRTFDSAVLHDALKSPSIALMKLTIEIDKQLRLLLGAVGALSQYRALNLGVAINLLSSVQGVVIPDALKKSIMEFWTLRNEIVHGYAADFDGLGIRAVDYGIRILTILASIPRPARIVRYVDVPVFEDELCLRQYENVLGVIVESFSNDRTSHGLHIFPSTLKYSVGDEVTWEWNQGGSVRQWGAAWYRNPAKHGEIESAWGESLEFIGRPISEV